jgi:hypothetical protein
MDERLTRMEEEDMFILPEEGEIAQTRIADPLNPDEGKEQAQPEIPAGREWANSMRSKLLPSEAETKAQSEIDALNTPEAKRKRAEQSTWGDIARSLGSGVAELGRAGGGERLWKSTEGVMEKKQAKKESDLRASLAKLKGERMEDLSTGMALNEHIYKMSATGEKTGKKYSFLPGTDPNTGKRVTYAVNQADPTDKMILHENPFAEGTFTNPETGEIISFDKTTKERTALTGTPKAPVKEDGSPILPSEAWAAVPPKVKQRTAPLLKEFRKVSKEADEGASEVNVVYNTMKEYLSQPAGQRNAQLLNLVKGKIPRLAGEKGPLAVFDIQMYAGNQSVYDRANRFFKQLYNGEATEKDMQDNFGLLQGLKNDMNSRISRKVQPFKTDIEREVGRYGVTADQLLGISEDKVAPTNTADKIEVRYNGKTLRIPKKDLDAALKDGATLVEK